jgi:type IV pilus assembly protein PilM
VRIWQRNVPIGGNHFTRALTKELKLTFSKAEHLKKNATKAPDPRAVFTAMRGIFNDFSSEVSRSIGFYSSVNRQAKIDRVVGLGNGFKLPGLQKFLQQNLNHEVERLESFNRLTNDEVTQAPQFVENLPSFAIAYGLGIQGLGRGQLRTNLLPAEIEQTRLIRKKKPWALAASALLLLGFTSLFFSDWAAWAKARSPEFTSAVDRANGVSTNGKNLQSGFDTAKKSFEDVKARGEALVGESTDTTDWPFLLQVVTRVLPKPAQELGVEGDDPRAIPILEQLRVHVDEVIPVWREDVATWFNDELTADDKQSMHPLDRESAPSGPGWVIQVIGHHYNPSPLLRRDVSEKSKQTLEKMKEMNLALGPLRYLVEQVLPRFWPAELRLLGINHAALTFFDSDTEWMKEKGDAGLPVALRSREVSAGDGTTEGTSAGGGLMGAMAARGGQGAMGMDDMQGMMKSSMGGGSMGAMMSSRGGRGGMLGVGGTPTKEKLSTLMRTKFRIEFVWQPVDPKAAPAKSVEDVRKEMADAFAKSGKGAIQALDEAKLIAAAKEAVKKKVLELKSQAQQVPGAVTAPSLPAAPATAPQTPAAPQPPTPPGAPAAKNQS